MVLRKPIPGQLSPSAMDAPPYPMSPSAPARHPPAPPQPEPYSPNLHESPAFNLQTLDEAQRSPTHYKPVGLEDEGDPWADEEGFKPKALVPDQRQPGAGRLNSEKTRSVEDVPAQLRPGGEATPRSSFESQGSSNRQPSPAPFDSNEKPMLPRLQSNNPFLKAQLTGNDQGEKNSVDQQSSAAAWGENPVSLEGLRRDNTGDSQGEIPIRMTASLTISDPPFSEFSPSYRPSDVNLNGQYQRTALGSSPPSSVAAGKRPQPVSSIEADRFGHTSEEQPPLIPVAPPVPVQQDYTIQNLWEETLNQEDQHRSHDYKPPPGPTSSYTYEPPLVPDTTFHFQPPLGPPPSHDRPQGPTQAQRIQYDDQKPPLFEGQGFDFPAGNLQPFRQTDDAKLNQRPWEESGRQDAFDDPNDFTPALPPRPAEQAPSKPPRPAPTFESKEELAKAQKQRSETYQIRQVNWLDATNNTLRQSPVLVQNANGPCPLLALVNAFSLSTPSNVDSALIKALRTREQVTLGLLMDAIFDELTSGRRGEFAQELPDVGDLYKFLVKLHTGMNVNPRFVAKRAPPPNLMDARNSLLHLPQGLNSDRKPGDFEETEEIRLYSTFGIPLIHGWLPPRAHESYHALERNAKTYEDAQNILFREEELEDKLSHEGLSQDEQQMLLDIGLIKHFLSSTATQLTGFGLDVISESLYPGAIAIFFRNDHFNTLYKHPLSNQLLTLVTDAGYATHDEIVWESLVDVSGEGCDFFAGDFRPVGNVAPEPSNPSSRRSSRQKNKHQNQPSVDSEGFTLVTPRRSSHNHDASTSEPPPLSPAVLQEDADLALALQLQEEEDDRARRGSRIPPQHQPGSSMLNPNSSAPSNRLTPTRSHTSETSTPPSIVTSGRRNRAATSQTHPRPGPPQEVRPTIPPRNSRNQGVNRPVDENDDAPPPSYEQAAKGRPYIPPEMNVGQSLDAGPPYAPLDPSPSASSLGLGTTPPYSGGVDDGRRRRPRVTVPGPSSGANMPGGYPGARYRGGAMTSPISALENQRGREREKDCVVM